ncbi:MAG: hypothetical protein F6K31_14955 [Symploca sp. SIO2G7]|nr:hypothetical protein [Symploca sp. SIO2G7]
MSCSLLLSQEARGWNNSSASCGTFTAALILNYQAIETTPYLLLPEHLQPIGIS